MKSPASSHLTFKLATTFVLTAVLFLGAAAAWQPAPVMARSAPQQFTITPSAGDHGVVDPLEEQTVPAGGSMLFRIRAETGYHIAEVRVDDTSVGVRTSYEFTNVQADHAISATFAADGEGPFTITPLPSDHGWIGPLVPQTVAAGASVVFTIGAFAGYHITDVLVDGASVGVRTSYEFTDVRVDHTISATFAVDTERKFTITPLPADHGWIGPLVPQTVAAGGSVLFTIGAFDGYHITDVLVDGVSVGARTSYKFTNVQADHTISATFAADAGQKYTITPSAGAHGAISPPTPQSVAAGSSVTFTMTADTGYHVADVLVDGASVGARSSYQFTNVQAGHTISASFAADTGPTVTITSPAGGELWRRGSSQAIRWTLSTPVSDGRFTLWASSPSGALTQLTPPGAPVAALAGSTDYEWSYTVALPATVTYQIIVRYESDAGAVQSEARSAGRVAVTAQVRLSVTKPSGAVTWRRSSNQTVRWTLSEPVAAGVFRVWALSAKGTRYPVTAATAPVKAVAGAASYSARWKVNAPPGKGYRIVVEHWWAGAKLAVGKSTGGLTITR